jgi:hypothetical protein
VSRTVLQHPVIRPERVEAPKGERTATNRRMTPEVLAAQDGVLAVFMGSNGMPAAVSMGDAAKWRRVVDYVCMAADDAHVDGLVVHLADAQGIRLLCVDDLCCVVVYQPTCKAAKSLPRSMRRCIEHIRAERRAADNWFLGTGSEMGGYDQDDDENIDPQGRTFR